MHKKIISVLSFITVFALFGIAVYCIFNGPSVENVQAKEKEKVMKKEEIEKTVYVDIKGAINNPGVYEMNSDSRVIDVIKEAGDLTPDADTSLLNLSKKVDDEMYIIIYTKDEINDYIDTIYEYNIKFESKRIQDQIKNEVDSTSKAMLAKKMVELRLLKEREMER